MNLKKGDNFEVMWVCIVFAFIFRIKLYFILFSEFHKYAMHCHIVCNNRLIYVKSGIASFWSFEIQAQCNLYHLYNLVHICCLYFINFFSVNLVLTKLYTSLPTVGIFEHASHARYQFMNTGKLDKRKL